jgi:hypothetical protein
MALVDRCRQINPDAIILIKANVICRRQPKTEQGADN